VSHAYTVVLRREPEGSYTVVVPALRGCLTSGDTVDEALDNAREVIPAFLEVMREDGEPLPPDRPEVRLAGCRSVAATRSGEGG
jgi:predicted RNase H-like HicB family nuclease